MHKRKLHHLWVTLKPLSYWYFLIAFVISSIVAIAALRQNNLNAIRMRDHVLQVDQQNGDVETALKELRSYIYGHMNTDLASGTSIYPPIQLKYRYERLLQAQKETVSSANSKIYNEAQEYCERQIPSGLSGGGRIPCIQQYVDSRNMKEQTIPDSLYKFNFASPVWSPDLAGWSIVSAIIFLLMFMIRYCLELWIRRKLDDTA